MPFSHSNVYIVRVVDTTKDAEDRTWFVGPYGSTRADQIANDLEHVGRESTKLLDRRCVVEPLWSDDDCLRVDDYNRAVLGSLQ